MSELNYQRSMNLGRAYLKSYDKDSVHHPGNRKQCLQQKSTGSREILLDYEFENLDSLVGLHTFDDVYLFGYAVKLKLLERQNCFVQEKVKRFNAFLIRCSNAFISYRSAMLPLSDETENYLITGEN